MRDDHRTYGGPQGHKKARGALPGRRPVELLSPSPPKESMQMKSTPSLSPSKSFTSNSSLPETPLSTSSTLPSSPEIEVTRRIRAVPAQNRAFQMALKSAFSENRQGISQSRTVTNQLSLDLREEDEPLIDLTEAWERGSLRKLSDLDSTSEKEGLPKPGTREHRSTPEEEIAQGKLSPWSKPFRPRSVASFDQHHQPDHDRTQAQSQTFTRVVDRNKPPVQHTFGRPFAVFSPGKRASIQSQHNLVYHPSSGSNAITPNAYTLATRTSALVQPSPKALFVPATPKTATLRAPEPLVQSPTQLPETPTKRVSAEPAVCFPRGRIALPYEDDYDSDDDPFFPAIHRKDYKEDSDSYQKEGFHCSDAIAFTLEPTSYDNGIDNNFCGSSETSAGKGLQSAGILHKHSRVSSLGIGHHPKDAFGEKHDASVVSTAVLRCGSGLPYLPAHGVIAEEHPSTAIGNTAIHTQMRERVATEPLQHRVSILDSCDPIIHARPRSEYNFTICRAHLRNLTCPYGFHCCFKHPSLSGPLDQDSLLAAEREMGWMEQARVNFGKIRGLLSTGTCIMSEDDQASIVLLFADSVCQNAASYMKPLEAVSPELREKNDGAEDQCTAMLQEGVVLTDPGPKPERLLTEAGQSVS